MSLETIEVSSGEAVDASIIWLHGLGADGHDFDGLVPQLQLPQDLGIRFIFPNAPYRAITLNNGYEMRAWYDLESLEIGQRQDEDGIRQSAVEIEQIIQQEIDRGISPQRIILAGFSQGGAIVLHLGLRSLQPLGGIMALSTYLPIAQTLEHEITDTGRNINIFMAHGRQDEVLAFDVGLRTRRHLESFNTNIEWHEYDMGHSLDMEELIHIRQWIISQLEN